MYTICIGVGVFVGVKQILSIKRLISFIFVSWSILISNVYGSFNQLTIYWNLWQFEHLCNWCILLVLLFNLNVGCIKFNVSFINCYRYFNSDSIDDMEFGMCLLIWIFNLIISRLVIFIVILL